MAAHTSWRELLSMLKEGGSFKRSFDEARSRSDLHTGIEVRPFVPADVFVDFKGGSSGQQVREAADRGRTQE
jgi:hypothetical protein